MRDRRHEAEQRTPARIRRENFIAAMTDGIAGDLVDHEYPDDRPACRDEHHPNRRKRRLNHAFGDVEAVGAKRRRVVRAVMARVKHTEQPPVVHRPVCEIEIGVMG